VDSARRSLLIGSRWLQDQVHVVGHQAIGPYRNARLQGLLGQQIEIDFLVAVFKEDGLAPVATLGNMMRKPRNHDPSESSHASEREFVNPLEVLGGGDCYKIDCSGVAEKKQMRGRNRTYRLKYLWLVMVGAEGFEPPTLCSQNRFYRLLKPVEIE